MTGPGALYGEDSEAAVHLALKHIDDSKQYPSVDLRVIVADSKSKPLRAVQLARKLIEEDKVNLLCGAVSSSVALAVTKIAEANKIIFIGTDHASPRLVDQALHPYYFRLNNGTRQSMWAGAQYIAEHYQSTKDLTIGFIGPDYDYGYRAWDDLRYFLRKQNIDFFIQHELWPKLGEKNFSLYINALINDPPDILINGHWGKDLVNFILQAKESGLFNQTSFMNFDAGGNYATLATLSDKMPLGLVLSARHHVNWPLTPANQQFVNDFFQLTGRYPSYAAEGAYSGIMAIAAAASSVTEPTESEQLITAFKSLTIKLPEDPEGFESIMDSESHQILQVQSIGKTMINHQYPPAKVMLGDWFDYYPPEQWQIE